MRKKEKTPKIIRNLGEFLEARGFASTETYHWARCFYKYNDCGPWASFLLREKEASARCINFAVGRNKSGKIAIVYDEEGLGDRDKLEPQDVRAFGFEEDRTLRPSVARSIKAYRKLAEAFAKETGTGYRRIEVRYSSTYGEYEKHRIWITAIQEIPEVIKDLYYEDLRKEGCIQPTNENCVGVTFGSIVEGSECYSGPFVHYFPFKMEDFDRDVEFMEKETSFYWERDNSTWYQIQNEKTGDQYAFHQNWDGIVWDSDKPRSPKLRKAADAFLENLAKEDYRAVNYDWHPLPPPAPTGWRIREYVNDSTY